MHTTPTPTTNTTAPDTLAPSPAFTAWTLAQDAHASAAAVLYAARAALCTAPTTEARAAYDAALAAALHAAKAHGHAAAQLLCE